MINVDKTNPVWVVTLNRPDKANALTEHMLIDLRDTARDAKDARGLILQVRVRFFPQGPIWMRRVRALPHHLCGRNCQVRLLTCPV